MSTTSSFEDLEVWKRACNQAVDVFKATENIKYYALRDQMQRSALSVPSNIAEGQERDTTPDFTRFLRISKGSNAELRTQLYIAKKLDQLPSDPFRKFIDESRQISKMLQGLIRSLPKTGN